MIIIQRHSINELQLSSMFNPVNEVVIDLVTALEAILTSRQPREKSQCLYKNLMSNNFRKTAVLEKNMKCNQKLHS